MITNDTGGITVFSLRKKSSERNEFINSVRSVQGQMKTALEFLRDELDEHLQAINENTQEIQQQERNVCEIDVRLTKLEEKMDNISLLLRQVLGSGLSITLSRDEQRVFLTLYTHDSFQSCEELGERSVMSIDVVDDCLKAMMDKGIPVEREILNGLVYFRLNSEFKLKQAKEQIITIDQEITQQFQNALLNQFFS